MPETKEVNYDSWVPGRVLEIAQALADSPGLVPDKALPVVERLICDPRMEQVWHELNKRKRENYASTEIPFHPSKLPQAVESWSEMAAAYRVRSREYYELGTEEEAESFERLAALADARPKVTPNETATDESRHQLALATLFARAVALYCSGVRTVTQKQVNKKVQALRDAGAHEKAAAFERHASKPEVQPMIVQRQRNDPRIEAFIEGLAATNRALFGKDLPSVIAIMTNVAFLPEKTFDRERIRAILKPYPRAAP